MLVDVSCYFVVLCIPKIYHLLEQINYIVTFAYCHINSLLPFVEEILHEVLIILLLQTMRFSYIS